MLLQRRQKPLPHYDLEERARLKVEARKRKQMLGLPPNANRAMVEQAVKEKQKQMAKQQQQPAEAAAAAAGEQQQGVEPELALSIASIAPTQLQVKGEGGKEQVTRYT